MRLQKAVVVLGCIIQGVTNEVFDLFQLIAPKLAWEIVLDFGMMYL